MTRLTPQDGIAIVTGASGGLGREMAIELCRQGFAVAGTGRRKEALEETGTLCAEGLFQPHVLDVSDAEAVELFFGGLGRIALLINNAAVYPHRDFLDESPQSFMDTVDVNLGGVVNCCHGALQQMIHQGRGRILNVATFADLNPLPTAGAYSVSKGAARILTRAMIADISDRFPDIVIGDWMPGMLKTSMGIPDGLDPAVSAKWGVELALRCDPALTGTIFEMDREVMAPRGLKGKIKDLVLMRRSTARRL